MLPWHHRLIEDLVDGVHSERAVPMPWKEKSSPRLRLRRARFQALNSLSCFPSRRHRRCS